jgi:hypothetical protein
VTICTHPDCKSKDLAPTATRCRFHQAEYMRRWRASSKERSLRAAYNAGVDDARDAIVAAFSQAGSLEMNGWAAAVFARQVAVR